MNRFRVWVAALCTALFAVGAHATPIQNTTGLVAPITTITFDELVFATGTLITNEYAGLGVTFSPGLWYDSQGPATFPGVTTHYVGNNFQCCNNPFSMLFGGDLTDAAFGVATNPANTLFEALNNGVLVESFSAPTHFDGSTNFFFGFSGILFDEVRVTVGGDQQILIDNVQLGSGVPEPLSLVLVATALFALALSRRRKPV